MDSGSTPQGIGRGHPSDQGFDRGVDGRAARRAAPGERGPVAEKAASLPAQHSGGGHQDEGPPPRGAPPRPPKPKEASRPNRKKQRRKPHPSQKPMPPSCLKKKKQARPETRR